MTRLVPRRLTWLPGAATGLALLVLGCSLVTEPRVQGPPLFLAIHGTSANSVFMTGSGERAWRYNGLFWKDISQPTRGFRSAVWSSSPQSAWAVGGSVPWGRIEHFDGRQWRTVVADTVPFIRAIWGSSPTNIHAVGDEQTLLHFDGERWTRDPARIGGEGIWGTSENDIFVIGGFPYVGVDTIMHYDGHTWTRQYAGGHVGLNAIWGTGPNDVFAVGGGGAVCHYDGTQWTLQRPFQTLDHNLFAVWGSSGGDVYAVGAHGTLLHYDGASWSLPQQISPHHLYAVWGSSPTDVSAAGAEGALLHFDGNAWRPVPLVH